MKTQLSGLINKAIEQLIQSGVVPSGIDAPIVIERARDRKHGDFACNIAMRLAKPAKSNPRELAQKIIEQLPLSGLVEKVEIAGPGFINFFIPQSAYQQLLPEIIEQGREFGRSKVGVGKKIQVEFVSANPTGPLHVGHGRGAAYGAVVSSMLEAVGYDVHKEYYVNDAGRQMDILATSVWLRYLEQCGEPVVFPSNGYKGEYILDISAAVRKQHGDEFRRAFSDVIQGVPADAAADGSGDKEEHIDGLIEQTKKLLGHKGYHAVFGAGLNSILTDIREDLAEFGVHYDEWFSERSLMDSTAVQRAMDKLKASGHVYENDGAFWFRSTDFGDEKDRVVMRDNGQTTYFASDIAYHMNKFERGFDQVVDVWGADHHGYVPRVKASIQAMGGNPDKLSVLLVQFAVLYRGGEKVQMSTRSGSFVTLRELREDVGNDAARFFYVMRKSDQHLDFDLDLATSKSNENPVFYIQYAHARICSVLRELDEKSIVHDEQSARVNLGLLNTEHEQILLSTLSRYPEVLESAALNFEAHQIPHYLRVLANDFHTYYNAHKFIVDDPKLRDARLLLIRAVRQVLQNGLQIIGVSAPEAM